MIYKYSQWLEESEKVEPAAPVNQEEADLTPAQMEAPAEPAEPVAAEPENVEEIDDSTEIGKFKKLDQARKDAVKAFKDKQKEFLDMPEETRKNPASDEDKQMIEDKKKELIELHTAMKNAEMEFNKFNEELLGLSEEEEDVEP
jgi:hypothetical protein